MRFAGTLKAFTIPNRPIDEEKSVQQLLSLYGSNSKKVIECAKWLLAVVNAEDRLLSQHRWRAVTRILQARLLAIAILLRGFPESDERELLASWERITFRIYGLGGYDARTKVGDYVRLAWRVENEKLDAKTILKELKVLGADYPINDVIEYVKQENCYHGWAEELRYFFYRYEEHLSATLGRPLNDSIWNRIWADEPSNSIEHIKPQGSGVVYVHHLGNLMMLPINVNSKLKDKDPNIKADTYNTCGLLSAVEVGKLVTKGKWDKHAVLAREDHLLSWAKEVWKD